MALTRGRRWLLIAAAALVLLCVSLGAAAWWFSSRPVDMLGLVRTRLAAHGGRAVSLSDVSPLMREAVVAAEDERFYRHQGIDSLGLVRAVAYDVSHGSLQQGASTITEQLAKVLYLGGDDHSLWRKVEDAALAIKIEDAYSKQQILGAYLNSVYFGEGAFGIAGASKRFFARAPSGLDLAQASLLAGMIQAPTAYDPVADPVAARSRQAEVLVSMIRNGFVTSEEASTVLRAPLPLSGGRQLAPDARVSLALPSLVSGPVLAGGLALLIAGAIGLVAFRRRGRRWITPLCVGLLVVGLLVVGRSLQAG